MTCSYLCLVIFGIMVSTVFAAPWRDTIILGDAEVIRMEADVRQIPKRSVQAKSENIVFPEDDYASSTTTRTQRPTAASFALPGVNSSTPGPNSISRNPVASVSSKLPGVKPVGLAFPESTSSSSSEEGEDDTGNVVIGTLVSKFISWVKEKGLPDNYTEPSTNIDDIPIDNFNLGRVQALKCPPGQVSHRGRCMNRAEI